MDYTTAVSVNAHCKLMLTMMVEPATWRP